MKDNGKIVKDKVIKNIMIGFGIFYYANGTKYSG